jgi:hypothetical protein
MPRARLSTEALLAGFPPGKNRKYVLEQQVRASKLRLVWRSPNFFPQGRTEASARVAVFANSTNKFQSQ